MKPYLGRRPWAKALGLPSTDHLLVYGQEGAACPFPCRYFGGENLPDEGMKSTTDYWRREDEQGHRVAE